MEREALKLTMEALINYEMLGVPEIEEAIAAAKKALAQPAQEPASVTYKEVQDSMNALEKGTLYQQVIAEELGQKKLYTTPPQRPWVDLTDKEMDAIYEQHHNQYDECESPNWGYERAIEQASKDKNK